MWDSRLVRELSLGLLKIVMAQKNLRTDPEEFEKQCFRKKTVADRVMLDTGPSVT